VDTDFEGDFGSSPASNWNFLVGVQALDGATTATVAFLLKLTYYTEVNSPRVFGTS